MTKTRRLTVFTFFGAMALLSINAPVASAQEILWTRQFDTSAYDISEGMKEDL
jgi:hypothetical protein